MTSAKVKFIFLVVNVLACTLSLCPHVRGDNEEAEPKFHSEIADLKITNKSPGNETLPAESGNSSGTIAEPPKASKPVSGTKENIILESDELPESVSETPGTSSLPPEWTSTPEDVSSESTNGETGVTGSSTEEVPVTSEPTGSTDFTDATTWPSEFTSERTTFPPWPTQPTGSPSVGTISPPGEAGRSPPPTWAIVLISLLITFSLAFTGMFFLRRYCLRKRKEERRYLLSARSQEGFFFGEQSNQFDNNL